MESTADDITTNLKDDQRPIALQDAMHLNECITNHDHSMHSDDISPITPMSVALRTVHPPRDTFSDLDFSSDTDGFDDIIKGPSPPPKRVMSSELKSRSENVSRGGCTVRNATDIGVIGLISSE